MNRVIYLFILGILLLFLFPNIILKTRAEEDCPFGYRQDPYPGKCWRYVDTNNDGICDLSQSLSTSSPQEPNENSTYNSNISTITQLWHENKNLLTVIVSFISIFLVSFTTKLLTKRRILSSLKEKIIWNVLLLIFFLPSGITGIILILMPSLPFLQEISVNFVDLHSYSSFFFLWISGYHILWHTKYYMNAVKTLFSKKI
jgi:hypothetical protein